MVDPNTGQNTTVWPIVYKSENVASGEEDPTTRVELYSLLQSKKDWLCKKQVNGQAFRASDTTGEATLYSTSSVLDPVTGLMLYILKAGVPYDADASTSS